MPSTVTLIKSACEGLRYSFDIDGVETSVYYHNGQWIVEPTERPIEEAVALLLPSFAASLFKSAEYLPAFRSETIPSTAGNFRIKYVEARYSVGGFRMIVRVEPIVWLALEHTGAILFDLAIIWADGTKSFAKKFFAGAGDCVPLRLHAGAYGTSPIIIELDAGGFLRAQSAD